MCFLLTRTQVAIYIRQVTIWMAENPIEKINPRSGLPNPRHTCEYGLDMPIQTERV